MQTPRINAAHRSTRWNRNEHPKCWSINATRPRLQGIPVISEGVRARTYRALCAASAGKIVAKAAAWLVQIGHSGLGWASSAADSSISVEIGGGRADTSRKGRGGRTRLIRSWTTYENKELTFWSLSCPLLSRRL